MIFVVKSPFFDKYVLFLCLQVEKLRSSFAKTLKENEIYAQYHARLENKVLLPTNDAV